MFNKKVLIFIFSILLMFTTKSAFAVSIEVPFGGMRVLTIPCTCGSPARYLLTINDYTSGRVLKLSYVPSISILYSSFNILSATYLLGTYNPTVRNMCWIIVSGDCEVVRDDGMLGSMPGTGFSF